MNFAYVAHLYLYKCRGSTNVKMNKIKSFYRKILIYLGFITIYRQSGGYHLSWDENNIDYEI